MTPILNACDVINQKGFKVKNEAWVFLLAVPLLAYVLEKHFEKTEGSIYCVDKVFYVLNDKLKELLGVEK